MVEHDNEKTNEKSPPQEPPIPAFMFPNIDEQLTHQGVIFLVDDDFLSQTNGIISQGHGPFEAQQKVMAAALNPTVDQIVLMINSNGGDVESHIALHDTILLVRRVFKKEVVTVVTGVAASGAALVLQAGNHRWVSRNSTVMIHRVSFNTQGTDVEHTRDTKIIIDKYQKVIFKIWANAMGISVKELGQLMRDEGPDLYYTAQQAVKNGLADKVI